MVATVQPRARGEHEPKQLSQSLPSNTQIEAFEKAPLNRWIASAEYLNRALIELQSAKPADLEMNRKQLEAMREIHATITLKLNHLDAGIDEFEKYLNEKPAKKKEFNF